MLLSKAAMLRELLWEVGESAAAWTFAFCVLTAIELAVPRGNQPFSRRLRGLLFWSMWIPVTAVLLFAFEHLWASLGVRPLLDVPMDMAWAGVLALFVAPLVAAFIGDFFFYWCHRAQHAFLWRYHAVHHSIRDLSAINSYHHVSEAAVQTLLITLPMSLIVPPSGPGLGIVMLLLRLQPIFLHSPTTWSFGPLGKVLADNRFHRIHHSLEERHFDKNFGAFTTFWDWLFGTAHFPRKDEWPDVGLSDVDEPRTVREWLDLPWRYGREGAAPASLPPEPHAQPRSA